MVDDFGREIPAEEWVLVIYTRSQMLSPFSQLGGSMDVASPTEGYLISMSELLLSSRPMTERPLQRPALFESH
jgi:hypothetical protein